MKDKLFTWRQDRASSEQQVLRPLDSYNMIINGLQAGIRAELWCENCVMFTAVSEQR